MFPEDEYKAYIKPGKRCACGKESANATVRLFKLPITKFARDGMPSGKWAWAGNFIRESDTLVTIEAVKEGIPKGGLTPLISLAREQGFKRLHWERVNEEGETRDFFYDLT